MNENYPGTLIDFGPLKCLWLGWNLFNIISALVRKKWVGKVLVKCIWNEKIDKELMNQNGKDQLCFLWPCLYV